MTVTEQAENAPSILVVDDEPDMRLLVRFLLEKDGFTVVDEAADGAEALERFRGLNPPLTPSVVLLDNRMPGLSGLEVAEQMLAAHPGQVIVLYTAQLETAVEERARDIGITACVSKVHAARLPEILRSLLQQG